MTTRHLTLVGGRETAVTPVEGSGDDWRGDVVAHHDGLAVVHVVAGAEDVPRLAGVAWALEAAGVFTQLVLDGGGGAPAGPALEDLGVPGPVRRVDVPAGSQARRLGALLEAIDGELAEVAPAVVMVHSGDDAALAGALGAARRGLPLVCVGAALGGAQRSAQVIDRLGDLLLAADERSASLLAARGIAPERVRVVGNPLADAVRHAGRDVAARRPWTRGGAVPGRYVLAILTGAEASPALARSLAALAGRVPLLADLSPAIRDAWGAAGMLAPLAASWVGSAHGGGFARRVALVRSAGAVITDSDTVAEAAALLGVSCHAAAGDDPWALAAVRPQPRRRPLRVIPMWDGRAGERIAEAMVANFARVRLAR